MAKAKTQKTETGNDASQFQSAVTETSKKVTSSLIPSIKNHIQSDKFDQKDGLDFLDSKNGIMLSYMIDLTQLLRLRSRKQKNMKQIEACLGRLREMKIVLEKVRPLEKKMRYQLDKLLALSASSSDFSAASKSVPTAPAPAAMEESNVDAGESSDPLAFRPNPESLLGKDDDDDDDASSDRDIMEGSDDGSSSSSGEDDDELMAARAALNAGRSKKSSARQDGDNDVNNNTENTGVYKAPRLAAMPFVEKEKQTEKEERILKKQRDRMKKSEVLSTLKAAFGDAPEEDDLTGGAALGKQREASRRFNEKMDEKTKYEEDAMIRLTVSRKEKKMMKKMMREEHSNLNSIADLGNIAAGVTAAFGGDKESSRSGNSFAMEDSRSSRHSNGKRRRDDGDFGDKSGSRNEPKRANPKNSFQKALYGMEGASSKKKKGGRRK